MENYESMPVFFCNGEKLPLNKIQDRKIVSVTVNYLSSLKEVKAPGIKGFFGKKKPFQETRELVVRDDKGLKISIEPVEHLTYVSFTREDEWEKTIDYDRDTLLKRYLGEVECPFQIVFHMTRLKNVVWL